MFFNKSMSIRINKIATWDTIKKLTVLVYDKLDLRNDLTEVHFDVATTESFPPNIRTKAVNPFLLPSGYKVSKNMYSIKDHSNTIFSTKKN